MQVRGSNRIDVSDRKGLKYKPRRDIPIFAREFSTLSPSKIREIVLGKRNKNVTAESITMWFTRHPDVHCKLKSEIIAGALPLLEVSETIFNNGTFEELPSVKHWIEGMEDRELVRETIRAKVCSLKRLCKGHNLTEEEWTYRHPDRLTIEDCKEYIRKVKARGKDTVYYRLTARNFLESKKMVVGSEISGSIEIGKYADLYVEKPLLNHIFNHIKARNTLAYRASFFSFKTGARKTAVLTAKTENLNIKERTIVVFEKARRKRKRSIKHVDDELMQVLRLLLDRKTEYLFEGLTDKAWREACREAYKAVIPEINKRIRMPIHFWRHMFAQHMLRATDWNYGVVASLGDWSIEALERSYGKPPIAEVRKWGLKYIPVI